jgi:DNA-directed RNA polymerase subunit F
MEPKIVDERPISMTELKTEIDLIKKRQEEASVRVTKVEDYLNSFSQINPAKEKELVDALKKLNVPRLKDEHLAKITDTIPKTVDDLKLIMQGYVISISADNIKKIVDVVNKVIGK